MTLIPRVEYKRDRQNIDHYSKTIAGLLRNCIDSSLGVEHQRFYTYLNQITALTPPDILPEWHKLIVDHLNKVYQTLKRIDMYNTTGNMPKLEACTVELDDELTYVTSSFFAWIKYLYDCSEGDDSYLQVIKQDYPEMYLGLIDEEA